MVNSLPGGLPYFAFRVLERPPNGPEHQQATYPLTHHTSRLGGPFLHVLGIFAGLDVYAKGM